MKEIKTMKTAIFIPVALMLVFFAPLSGAEVMELNVSPQVVDSGDVITISGTTSPSEVVWLGSSFELPLPVSDGRYGCEFDDINFPDGEKKFSVTAENIKNLDVTLYPMHFWSTIEINCSGQTMTATVLGQTITTPLSESIDETGTASFSMSFPIEKYGLNLNIDGLKDITVSGDAADGASTVNLKLASSIKLIAGPTPTPTPVNDAYTILQASVGLTTVDLNIADIDGDGSITANDAYSVLRRASGGIFSFDMNTNGIPDGEFLITAGGKTETVYIGVEPDTS
ncbi:MAG: hypothetical protein LAKADJCE_00493 [Candidatus Argoarchaeum ethanivorans]|uniref:Dockerin domain-containing protein n=1 Tax=Candidatus Argoarchaeum ethanivorans TaxID=2608793 RepID=A0A811TFQ2_9EURY|nr:MAG: hypothetical protein LAKADJCE_00493 [Candidatus Argoarchaeum ethanivorans]